MLRDLLNFVHDTRDRQRIGIALSKGGAMMHARRIDLACPQTWEFSGFSQNGEDGILDVLRSQLLTSNRYFVEIGSADGVENNSGWLVVAERYEGLMIEGESILADRARRNVARYSIGTECHALFVTLEVIPQVLELARHHDPDVFSLDIDGNDYHIAHAMMARGFRPRIVVVEYNSAYGPERSLTIPYRSDFRMRTSHPSGLHYGVSIAGWKRHFERHGYRFICVDRNGVNGFFVDPEHFNPVFLAGIRGLDFVENRYQLRKFGKSNEGQFQVIADQAFVTI